MRNSVSASYFKPSIYSNQLTSLHGTVLSNNVLNKASMHKTRPVVIPMLLESNSLFPLSTGFQKKCFLFLLVSHLLSMELESETFLQLPINYSTLLSLPVPFIHPLQRLSPNGILVPSTTFVNTSAFVLLTGNQTRQKKILPQSITLQLLQNKSTLSLSTNSQKKHPSLAFQLKSVHFQNPHSQGTKRPAPH